MARPEPTMATTCNYCGKAFKTSQQHPRRYCSIACEEGRGTRAMDDPQSPDYHLHLQANPESLVGKEVLASGLKRVDYSSHWSKDPDDWRTCDIVSVDEENLTYVRKDDVFLGRVVDYGADGYTIERHTGERASDVTTRTIHDFEMVAQIRRDRWWVDG